MLDGKLSTTRTLLTRAPLVNGSAMATAIPSTLDSSSVRSYSLTYASGISPISLMICVDVGTPDDLSIWRVAYGRLLQTTLYPLVSRNLSLRVLQSDMQAFAPNISLNTLHHSCLFSSMGVTMTLYSASFP